jgi:DNA mismatch repair protein MutS
MIEMVETAAILHQATRRSLVIVDELGRGTGTADGLAIARAVLEDLHGRVRARALLATHYLELTALADELPGVANAHVAALESEEGVVFLYALRPGPAGRAYGVQVARLAGLPPWVVARAETLLDDEPDPSNPRRSVDHTDNASSSPRSLVRHDHRQPPDRRPAQVAESTARSYDSSAAPPPVAPLNEPLAAASPSIDPAIERLAAALRSLDLANTTPRQALDWLFDQRDRLLDDDAAGV